MKATPTTARRNELLAKKYELEKLIPDTIDPVAVAKLREDYRAILNELETYYFDEPVKQPNQ
ncbi:hypothetical protein HQ865_01340 [Mucilaginibacter mali]|uniref:Uncharacterized protein n=1 Tax=Mucilaginibacter mali TaxID=2740462 RepID=A0A7D4UBS7_9SPHI|nr:hypothetical protein [Mucilaginibacter mali]QKJ28459.1 hypothetical protein HQ865_01340 [Mucilaginibacter mali]